MPSNDDGLSAEDHHDWYGVKKKPVHVEAAGPFFRETVVNTLEGDFEVDEEYARGGFYLIRGVEGEIYPCRADIMLDSYETPDGEELKCELPGCTDPVDPTTGYCCLEHERLDNAE